MKFYIPEIMKPGIKRTGVGFFLPGEVVEYEKGESLPPPLIPLSEESRQALLEQDKQRVARLREWNESRKAQGLPANPPPVPAVIPPVPEWAVKGATPPPIAVESDKEPTTLSEMARSPAVPASHPKVKK